MMAAVTPTGATGAAGVALRVQAMDMRREEPGHSTAISSLAYCIPGFRTSAAFYNSLRANLRLATDNDDVMASPTPATTPPHPSPSSDSTTAVTDDASTDPLAGVPPLTTSHTTETADIIAALHLVADSVAQQRQNASRALILHPLSIAAWAAMLGLLSHFMWRTSSDLPVLFTTSTGLTMAVLLGVRAATQGYLAHAEAISWAWFHSPGEPDIEDHMLVTHFGDELIGAVVLRFEPMAAPPHGQSSSPRKKNNRSGSAGRKAVLRAWTVRLRYRGKGVGRNLLEEAVRFARERLGDSAQVEWADTHANHQRVLPSVFNGGMDRGDKRARALLEDIVVEEGGGKSKKRR